MRVFVCGGTGFVGTGVVEALLDQDHDVTCLVRDPKRLGTHRTFVNHVVGDIALPHTYAAKLPDHAAAINCVGLLRERWDKKGVTYERVVVRGTQAWVRACKDAGVKHLLLISALGANPDGTPYQRSKWMAEQAVRNSGLTWTIFRPSLIYGPGEDFASAFARLMRLRLVPDFAGEGPAYEPVARGDVAKSVVASLKNSKARNRVFHLAGPDQLTLREMYDAVKEAAGIKARIVRMPRAFGHAATASLGWLPFFPATHENFKLLLEGSVAPERDWESVFGIQPVRFHDGIRESVTTSAQA